MDAAVLSGGPAEAAPSVQQAAGGDAPVRGHEGQSERARLPGVQVHNDGEPWIKLKGEAEPAESDEGGDDAPGRPRDQKGRFTKAEIQAANEAAEEQGKPGEVAPKPELPAGTEPPKQKFKFAGKEWESPEKAEQAHKSLQGMFQHKEAQIKSLSEERDYGYRAATAWQERAQQYERELQELRSGKQTQTGAQVAGQEAKPAGGLPELSEVLNGIDTEAFEALAVQQGLPSAGKYLASEVLNAVINKILPSIRAEYESKLAPFETERANHEGAAQADALVRQVAQLQSPSGGPAFPELMDPALLTEIGNTWRESGLPIEHALTPQGLMNAVGFWRMVKGGWQPPTYGAPVAPQVQSQPVAAPIPAPAAAASVDGDERGGIPHDPNRGRSPEHRRLIAALEDVNFVDRSLGFTTHRKERTF